MNRFKQVVLAGLAASLIAAAAAGCQKSALELPGSEDPILEGTAGWPESGVLPSEETSVKPGLTPELSPTLQKPGISSSDNIRKDETEVETADPGKDEPQGAAPKPEPVKPQGFDPERLTLLELSIQDLRDPVLQQLGAPQETYRMDIPGDPINVYVYDGYMIGFNSKQRLTFVEVYNSSVNPLLGGLQVGQTAAGAVEALGKPTMRSNYVLTYKANGIVLKLDIDPVHDTILSIKLFSDK